VKRKQGDFSRCLSGIPYPYYMSGADKWQHLP
jgi:hypothetical protein